MPSTSVAEGGGGVVGNSQILRDVIYECPLGVTKSLTPPPPTCMTSFMNGP